MKITEIKNKLRDYLKPDYNITEVESQVEECIICKKSKDIYVVYWKCDANSSRAGCHVKEDLKLNDKGDFESLTVDLIDDDAVLINNSVVPKHHKLLITKEAKKISK